MRRTLLLPLASLLGLAACSDSATAPAPTGTPAPSFAITFKPRTGPTVDFVSATSANLEASFDISGLGNSPTLGFVTVEATAQADAVYACRNNGGNFPEDPKKQDVAQEVKVDEDFPVKNGRATGDLVLPVPASTLSCPGGQTAVLVSVVWTEVEISVVSPPGPTADSSSPGIQDSYTKTFFVLD
jgi:hypothetical protein